MSELNDTATNIYNRLASAPTFHPAGADLFTDWNMQAGDVVTVKAGTDSYNVPIYNMRLHWAGDSKIEVESTGNPEREPLPAIKRREYASGASAYGGIKSLGGALATTASVLRSEISSSNSLIYTVVQQTETELRAEMHNIESDMQGEIVATAQALHIEYSTANSQIYSTINITATSLRTEYSNAESGLYSSIEQTASQIRTEVHTADYAMQSEIVQNASQIALRVKNGDVATELAVECGNVSISNGNLVVDGYITSSGLSTAIANMGTVDVSALRASGNITASGAVYGSGIYLGSSAPYTSVGGAVASFGTATASGGSITIPTTTLAGTAGPSINFNIADTQYYKNGVSAAWTNAANTARINNSYDGPGDSSITLSSGESVSVYAQVKANSSAVIYTTVGTVTVTASGGGSSDFQLGSVKTRNANAIGASVYVNYYLNGSWHSETKTVQQE